MDFKSFSTAHYTFHYESGSLAEQEIAAIAAEQEQCFDRICTALGVSYSIKIA